jgi:hypothetical protein
VPRHTFLLSVVDADRSLEQLDALGISQSAARAKFGAWLRLRQFKVPCAVLFQQDAEREAIHGFAVLHRCQALDDTGNTSAELQARRVSASSGT